MRLARALWASILAARASGPSNLASKQRGILWPSISTLVKIGRMLSNSLIFLTSIPWITPRLHDSQRQASVLASMDAWWQTEALE
jgi:hypothetical protein